MERQCYDDFVFISAVVMANYIWFTRFVFHEVI